MLVCWHILDFLVFVQATQGWDPVTGLGTPNFLKLKNIFLNFPLGGLLGGLLGALAKTLSLSVDADLTVTLL